MNIGRRHAIAGGLAIALLAPEVHATERNGMYGLLGKMRAQPGKRAELIAILLEGTDAMPGCKAYIVAKDVKEPDAIWITEVWTAPRATRPRSSSPPSRPRSPKAAR